MKYPSTIFIDIETVPGPNVPSPDNIKAPANYKDPDKIRAYQESKVEESYQKQALDSMQGRILAIGFAIDDNPAKVFIQGREAIANEEQLLRRFEYEIENISPVTWVGHNIKSFDLQWLWRKAIRVGSPLALKIPRDRWNSSVKDTMELWSGPDLHAKVSLDNLAQFLGESGKTEGMDGSKVFRMYQNGELDTIRDYCLRDVEVVRNVYRRMEDFLR